MVALAPITNDTSAWDVLNTFPKLHSRAREVKTTSCTEARDSKSLDRVEIWQAIYESCDGLESSTRDPIEYLEVAHSLPASYLLGKILIHRYQFLIGSPLLYTDELGLHVKVPIGSNGAGSVTGSGDERVKCYDYYPGNLECNGLKKACFCRTKNHDPNYPIKGEGCTRLKYTIFTPACDQHDICWSTCGADQTACDKDFLKGMLRICDQTYTYMWANVACRLQAMAMYRVVQNNSGYFEQTQDDACTWEDCTKQIQGARK